MLKVITFLTCIQTGTFAGCRWYNPAWLQKLNSAPQVDISTDQLVRSYANSIIDVKCNGTSKTKKVVIIQLGINYFPVIQVQSSSCLAASPKWQSNPNINKISGNQLRLLKHVIQLIDHKSYFIGLPG